MLEILRSMGYNKVPGLPFYIHQDYDRLYVYEIENMKANLYPLNVMKGEYLSVAYADESYHIHRLKAMTYIPLPEGKTFDDVIVNHKDGKKWNNKILNLEWTTYKGNIEHAFENGLRNDNIPVYVRDVWTGEVSKIRSKSKAMEYIGCGWGSFHHNLTNTKPSLIALRYEVADSESGLFNIQKEDIYKYSIKQTPVKLINKRTEESISFPMLKSASEYLGKRINRYKVIPNKVYVANEDYFYIFITDFDELREVIEKSQKRDYSANKTGFVNIPSKIEVKFPNGEVRVFNNLSETAVALKAGFSALEKRLSAFNGNWKGHELKYITVPL